jgi:APA family basic amino acid/polyamine antiporter/amino acid efflux transporter
LNETKPKEILPKRTLKLSQGIIYGVGCGIGGSIFVLLGLGIEYAGSGILLSLILGGILIFFTGLNYAELSTSLPMAGGAYNFSKEGIGGFLAFIIGFFLWIANVATCSFSAQIFALVFNEVFIKLNIPISNTFITVIAILPIILTSLVIFRTQKVAIKALLIFTFVLIGMFAFFIIFGLIITPFTNPNIILTQIKFEGIIPAFLLLFILFTSITSNLAYLNPDLKNPSKNIPKTIIYAILLTLIIYLSITFIALINLGENPTGLTENPVLLADVFESVLGPFGFYFMVIAAIISTLIAINAALGSAVSVITALARDRFIPKKIQETKKRPDMPALGLLITIILVVLFVLFAGIGFTAEITNFIYFVGLAFVNFAAVKLRRTRKELDRPFKAPFFPFLPIFISICFLVFAVILGVIISIEALILGLIIFIIGIAFHLLTIADKSSINLTLTGIKFFFLTVLGMFIWVINNFSYVNPILILINRILIGVCVFTIGTVILDLLPLRELAYYYVKKMDKGKVAINIGNAQIIDLGKKRSKIIHLTNLVIAIIQFIACGIIFSIVYFLFNNLLSIQEIILIIGTSITYIPSTSGTALFISILIIFGLSLFFCGILSWQRIREFKTLGL